MEKLSENFLLSEFEQTYAEYRRLLDEGNQRIPFLFIINSILFLGGVMAITGDWLGHLAIEFVFLPTLILAFLANLFTYQYMLKRRVLLDLNTRALARIRRYFIDRNSELLPYLTAKVDDTPSTYLVKKGFLIQYVIIMFSIVIGIELTMVLNFLILVTGGINLIIILVLSLMFMFILSMLTQDKLSKKLGAAKEEVRFPKIKKTI